MTTAARPRPGRPVAGPPRIVWEAQPGSQALFLGCPVREIILTGTRGSAKTNGLLQDYAQHVGAGHGRAWRGILFRRTYKQLDDVIEKSLEFFPRVFPGARFLSAKDHYEWRFPEGEALLFRHMDKAADYWNYHGHEYPWIAFEELTNWPDLSCYQIMKSTNRTSVRGVPLKYRATCNPYGVGHNAVKLYIVDPAPPGAIIPGEAGWDRVRIRCHYSENKILLAADPNYPATILSAAAGDAHLAAAWLNEDWNIVAGGFLDDLWRPATHVLAPFAIPPSWRIDRSFDWGSAKPFSVGWWAESDGTAATLADGTTRHFPRDTLIRIGEWYGWVEGKPNLGSKLIDSEIARGILERERQFPWGARVQKGPADSSIFDEENGDSPAKIQERVGVRWEKADKRPGSRKRGWKILRQRLKATRDGSREDPHLYVFDTCRQFLRTVPLAPRDEKDPDDIDSEYEDHILDETRYRLLAASHEWTVSRFKL